MWLFMEASGAASSKSIFTDVMELNSPCPDVAYVRRLKPTLISQVTHTVAENLHIRKSLGPRCNTISFGVSGTLWYLFIIIITRDELCLCSSGALWRLPYCVWIYDKLFQFSWLPGELFSAIGIHTLLRKQNTRSIPNISLIWRRLYHWGNYSTNH